MLVGNFEKKFDTNILTIFCHFFWLNILKCAAKGAAVDVFRPNTLRGTNKHPYHFFICEFPPARMESLSLCDKENLPVPCTDISQNWTNYEMFSVPLC